MFSRKNEVPKWSIEMYASWFWFWSQWTLSGWLKIPYFGRNRTCKRGYWPGIWSAGGQTLAWMDLKTHFSRPVAMLALKTIFFFFSRCFLRKIHHYITKLILLCTFIHNVLTYLILRNKFGVADFIGFIWSRPSPSKNFFLGNIFYGYLYVFKRVGKKYWHIHPIFQVFFSFLSNSTEQRCMNCRELMKIHYIRCVLKHKSCLNKVMILLDQSKN